MAIPNWTPTAYLAVSWCSTTWSRCSTWSRWRRTSSAGVLAGDLAGAGVRRSGGRAGAGGHGPHRAGGSPGALAARLLPAARRPAGARSCTPADRSRDGRSFTTRRVVAIQHGQTIFTMSGSFQIDEPGHRPRDADAARRSRTRRRCPPAPNGWPGCGTRSGRGLVFADSPRAFDVRYVTEPPWAVPAGGPDADRAHPGVVQGRRRRCPTTGAARLPAGLPVRPDRCWTACWSSTACRPSPNGYRWRRWTMPCGSTGRSGSTSGCCTTSARPARRVRAGSASARSSPPTVGCWRPWSRRGSSGFAEGRGSQVNVAGRHGPNRSISPVCALGCG